MDSQHYERSASYQMNSDGTSKQNKGWKIAATIGAVILLIAMLVTVTVLACAVFCIIAWESSAAGIIIFGILAGGAVGALGVFGSVKLFLLFKKLIWGR